MKRPIRIANCSGFYGDRLSAAREMLAGPIDMLTGDYSPFVNADVYRELTQATSTPIESIHFSVTPISRCLAPGACSEARCS